MKRLLILSIFIYFYLLGNSQSKLTIVDGVTKDPLPYTTIQSINKKEGFITDDNV